MKITKPDWNSRCRVDASYTVIQYLKDVAEYEQALKDDLKKNIEEAAKLYIGVRPDLVIDEEERYYLSGVKEYDAFIAGAKWIQDNLKKESL